MKEPEECIFVCLGENDELKYFILDHKKGFEIDGVEIKRYAVFYEGIYCNIVESSDDLEKLKQDYNCKIPYKDYANLEAE